MGVHRTLLESDRFGAGKSPPHTVDAKLSGVVAETPPDA